MVTEKRRVLYFVCFRIYPGIGCFGTSVKGEFVIHHLVLPLFGEEI